MTEHTPGPWEVCEDAEGGQTVIRDATGFAICSEWHFLIESSLANARLIAAAPELLEVCIHARACFLNLQPDGGPIAQQMQKMVAELSTAINKAKGE
jgi:hypothetical protein